MLRIQTICLVILTLIAVGFALHYLQTVLLPFVIAFFIVSGCRPILDFLENRYQLHWVLSFAVTFGIGVVFLAGFSFLTWLSINDMASHFPKFEQRITDITNWISERFPDPVESEEVPGDQELESSNIPNAKNGDGRTVSNDQLGSEQGNRNRPLEDTNPLDASSNGLTNSKSSDDVGGASAKKDDTSSSEPDSNDSSVPSEQSDNGTGAKNELSEQTGSSQSEDSTTNDERADLDSPDESSILPDPTFPGFNEPVDPEELRKPSQFMKRMFESLGNYAQRFLLSFAGTLTSLLSSAILILIYVFFLLLGRAEAKEERIPIVKAIDDQIRKYIVMKTVISAITGFATWFVLWLFGVPLAVVFGLLTFLINFIPNIGPIIISLLPLPFLILNPEMNVFVGLLVFLLVAAIQFISGNVIETRMMGRSFDVNPVVLLLSLMFFGLIWGIPGMFLATPIVSVMKIVLQQRDTTRPFADMLAGRWDGSGLGRRA